jgi:FdhE protein
VTPCLPALVETVVRSGPAPLAREGSAFADGGPSAIGDVLLAYWLRPSDAQFFGKACLQPYARTLAERGIAVDRALPPADNRCPVCRNQPQVAVLRPSNASDVGGRHLVCALCLSPWPFGRLVCAACGEIDERQLGYYHAESYDHVRVDACGACNSYLKTIDLSRRGDADPITDEIAAAPLDVWAREHGYRKIEMNLVGL